MRHKTLFVSFYFEDLVAIHVIGFDLIEIENWNDNKCGESCVKSAVIEDEAAVHCRGGCADDGTDKTCQNAVFEAVAACDGAKTRSEGKTVYICLSLERPRNGSTRNGAECTDDGKKNSIS